MVCMRLFLFVVKLVHFLVDVIFLRQLSPKVKPHIVSSIICRCFSLVDILVHCAFLVSASRNCMLIRRPLMKLVEFKLPTLLVHWVLNKIWLLPPISHALVPAYRVTLFNILFLVIKDWGALRIALHFCSHRSHSRNARLLSNCFLLLHNRLCCRWPLFLGSWLFGQHLGWLWPWHHWLSNWVLRSIRSVRSLRHELLVVLRL